MGGWSLSASTLDFLERHIRRYRPESVLESAARLGITAVASATLMQTHVMENMPDSVAARLPGLETNAQRAIQFTRSTPGITVALVGMSKAEHVSENIAVSSVAPAALKS